MKKPYNHRQPCHILHHKDEGEIAATCGRCHTLAKGQQRKQWEEVRKSEQEKYIAKQYRQAA